MPRDEWAKKRKGKAMLFSVIVPVYNVESYLPHCLDSLAGQTCTDKEVILVDDGSTDSSGALCDEYATRYGFFSVIHQDNQGLSAARNAGLATARGEWLSFVDGDDWVDTDLLERLQGYILATRADMYRFGFRRTGEDGKELGAYTLGTHTTSLFRLAEERERFWLFLRHFTLVQSVCTGIYRRAMVQEHEIAFADRRKVFVEDTLFNYHCLLHARGLVSLPSTPYHYRARGTSFCHTTGNVWKIERHATLGECAYREAARWGMAYHVRNFHRHYFRMLDMGVRSFAGHLTDGRLRQVLDGMRASQLHRQCLERIRRDRHFFAKMPGRAWYEESFGKEMTCATSRAGEAKKTS